MCSILDFWDLFWNVGFFSYSMELQNQSGKYSSDNLVLEKFYEKWLR